MTLHSLTQETSAILLPVPVWVRIEEVPYHEMWEDDKYWLPAVLRGEKIYGRFFFERWRLKKWEVYLLKDAGQSLLNLRQLPT